MMHLQDEAQQMPWLRSTVRRKKDAYTYYSTTRLRYAMTLTASEQIRISDEELIENKA